MSGQIQPNSAYSSILRFLQKKGESGAYMSEIYKAVKKDIGESIPYSSVRSAIYHRLANSKSHYVPRFERFEVDNKTLYRLLIK